VQRVRERRRGRRPVSRGSRQSFRECEVCRIVRRDGVPELPDPGEQHVVRITTQGQRGEVLKRLGASRGVELGGERVSAEDLGHFEIQQVGSVQRLSVGKEAIGRSDAGRRIQQDLGSQPRRRPRSPVLSLGSDGPRRRDPG